MRKKKIIVGMLVTGLIMSVVDVLAGDEADSSYARDYVQYEEIIHQYVDGINEGWDEEEFKNHGLYDFGDFYEEDLTLSDIGYYIGDIDGNDEAELLIGPMDSVGEFYDMYTMVYGLVQQVVINRQGLAEWYYLCEDNKICNEKFIVDRSSITAYYRLNNDRLKFIESIDLYEDGSWYYSDKKEWKDGSNPISEEEAKQMMSKYKKVDIPYVSLDSYEPGYLKQSGEIQPHEEIPEYYNEVLAEYKHSIEAGYDYVINHEEEFPVYSYLTLNDYTNVFYSLYDIDGNGTQELIMELGWNDDPETYQIFDIWGYNGSEAKSLLNGSIASDQQLYIYIDGTIVIKGMENESSGYYWIMEIQEDGVSLEIQKEWKYDEQRSLDVYFYNDEETCSKEEMDLELKAKGNVYEFQRNKLEVNKNVAETEDGQEYFDTEETDVGNLENEMEIEDSGYVNDLDGNWCTENGHQLLHIGNVGEPEIPYDGYWINIDFNDEEKYYVKLNYETDGILITSNADELPDFKVTYNGSQMMTEEYTLSRVPDEYTNRILGVWHDSNNKVQVEFKENNGYELTRIDENSWGHFYPINDEVGILSKKSDTYFKVIPYTYDGDSLKIEDILLGR